MPIDLLADEAPIDLLAGIPSPRGTASTEEDSLPQWLGVANRALAPYATAAGAGALAGGVPTGGVGALPGAALGVTALGLTDLGTSLYNVGSPYFGYSRVPTGSEAIRDIYGSVGVGKAPKTTGQKVFSSALEGAASGGAQAKALSEMARFATSPTTRNVLSTMGQQPVIQGVAGAGATVAPTVLNELGVTNPYALAASSLLGGFAAGKTGAGVAERAQRVADVGRIIKGGGTPSTSALKEKAQAAYAKAEDAGMIFNPTSYDNLVDDIGSTLKIAGFNEDLSPKTNAILKVLNKSRGNAQSLSDMDNLRKIASQVTKDIDPNERRLAHEVINKIDSFITDSPSANLISGDADVGVPAILAARDIWKKRSKSSTIEDLIDRAALSTEPSADALKTQFATLARNKNRMSRFTEAEQRMINDVATGKSGSSILKFLSSFAPGTDVKGLVKGAVLFGPSTLGGSPELAIGAGALGAVGLGSKAARNTLAEMYAKNIAATMRRGDARLPIEANNKLLLSPSVQEMIQQMAQ